MQSTITRANEIKISDPYRFGLFKVVHDPLFILQLIDFEVLPKGDGIRMGEKESENRKQKKTVG